MIWPVQFVFVVVVDLQMSTLLRDILENLSGFGQDAIVLERPR